MPDPHLITLEVASLMTKAYRDARINNIISNSYERAAFDRILSQEGCVGIRAYFALTTEQSNPGDAGRLTLVFVGYDSQDNDLYERELAEAGWACPPRCPELNPLNNL